MAGFCHSALTSFLANAKSCLPSSKAGIASGWCRTCPSFKKSR